MLTCLLATLYVWHRRDGNIRVDPIVRRDAEITFCVAVLFSNCLGTAMGDFLVDVVGLGYTLGDVVSMGVIAASWRCTTRRR